MPAAARLAGATTLGPGFADPERDAQRVFRVLLDAMARPGSVHALAAPPAEPPAPLGPAAAAACLALLDLDTPAWLDPAARDGGAPAWLRFHAGCPLADDPARAAFGVIADPAAALLPFDRFPPGEDAYPDRSASLIVQVAALDAGQALRLSGPGIETETVLRVAGLPAGFVAAWAANHALFPCGLDLILCAGDRLACLPRSVRMEG